nr:alcohol dehydrogenase catalytic domain-containing protein [Phytoactinopolyspora halotolerans]
MAKVAAMAETAEMEAVRCHGPRDYRLERVPVPEPGPGEILLRSEAVGICGSDLKCFGGAPMFWGDETRTGYCQPPVTPGHEFVGRVAALDDDARERHGVDVGDRVAVEQIVPCEACAYCKAGQYWLCAPHDIFGFRQRTPGAMGEYMVVPAAARVHAFPADLPPSHAALAEPLSCSLHAVDRGEVGPDDVVVVAGAGPIGLGMVLGARRRRPRALVAIDLDPHRRTVAQQCGADVVLAPGDDVEPTILELTDGLGCDVYLDATGHPAGVTQGLQLLRKRGRFIEYGVFGQPVTTDWTVIGDGKELDIRGAHLGPNQWPTAIEMLSAGEVPAEAIVTHEFPIDRFDEAFETAGTPGKAIKVSVLPPGGQR